MQMLKNNCLLRKPTARKGWRPGNITTMLPYKKKTNSFRSEKSIVLLRSEQFLMGAILLMEDILVDSKLQ